MTKPNWNDAPEWAQWLAQDFNGDWCWYEEMPMSDDKIEKWLSLGKTWQKLYSYNSNWKQTLEKRPVIVNNIEDTVCVTVVTNNLCWQEDAILNVEKETVNHPSHYNQIAGIECIDVARHFSFNLGNVIKYVWRAYHKNATIEDLQKAVWYLQDEIKMLQEKQ